MTTENTTVEAVEIELTPEQIAENFIKENTSSMIVEEFVNHYNTIESLKKEVDYKDHLANVYSTKLRAVVDTITDFIREHVSEEDSASVEELKELAQELDIELTKNVTVTFSIEVTAEFTVPLDFVADDINDGDFEIDIEYKGDHDEVECDEVSSDIDDFVAEEN